MMDPHIFTDVRSVQVREVGGDQPFEVSIKLSDGPRLVVYCGGGLYDQLREHGYV